MRAGTPVNVNNWSSPYRDGTNEPNTIAGISPATWFSPLQPLPNYAPEDVGGRTWDYQVGYNLNFTPRPNEKYSFKYLREIAAKCDIMSIIISNQKDQIESREWVIKPTDDMEDGEDDPRIKEVTDFFQCPDKIHSWDQWLRMLLDDLLIIDAPSLFVNKSRGGSIYSLDVIDGGTVNLLIDAYGKTPQSPNPAYQRILKGVPAVALTTDELIYMPRNRRTNNPYGRSPVEQTVVTINAAINRALFNQNYYKEGNIPDAIAWLPDNFTPQHAKDFTEWWDSLYSGNLAQKRKVKFIPGKGNFQQIQEPELKNVYDDYIARLLCFAMGISPQPFISQMNRATASTAKETADESGKAPIENWVKNLHNRIIQSPQFFNYPDLKFDWAEKEDQDPAQVATILSTYVKDGILTMDEARERLGEEARGGISSEPGIITATGFITLEDAKAQTQANIEASKQPMGGAGVESEGLDSSHPSNEEKAQKAHGSKKNFVIYINRPAVKKAKEEAFKILKPILSKIGKDFISKLQKDDSEDDFSDLEAITPILMGVANDSALQVIGNLNLETDNIVNQVNQRAVKWAKNRAAEMISQVTQTTRDRAREIIAQGLEDNLGRDDIAEALGELFGDDRAQFIADTEVGNANGHGALEGLYEAEDNGVKVLKEWYPDEEACPICLENADDGPIPLDEEFSSGDDAPLAHPNCECSLLGVVES